ncbi:unnamed protein product [Effrenium voratum]|nr:unnamed protein product [Effrenium voratum]CAJ1417092.1 unnamed protein product [Effrenium voratum]
MQFQGFGNSGCSGCGCNGASFQPGSPAAAQSAAPSPLLKIRAGIEAGNHAEVLAAVREADQQGVALAPNVRDMITQWLSVNAPKKPEQPPPPEPAPAPPPGPEAPEPNAPTSAEKLRNALLRFFELAPKASDAAAGLGIIEGKEGNRYLPLPVLGRAVGITGEDFEVAMKAWTVVNETPAGIFMLTEDARAVGLVEWAGWEEFSSSLDVIVNGTRDPAFEPRSIQGHVARAARGAVRSGPLRQPDVLRRLQELSSENLPEDAAPALRSAIQRRARLALACLVDAIASQGLGPQAGLDSMGLVGQLPRTLFGIIFDNIDDRDRGACAFLGEILQSWDRRRCFSKKWLQDAAGKFSMPKGPNSERDERRGWYALTSENLHRKPAEEEQAASAQGQAFLSTDDTHRAQAGEKKAEAPKKDSKRKETSTRARSRSPRSQKRSPRKSPKRSPRKSLKRSPKRSPKKSPRRSPPREKEHKERDKESKDGKEIKERDGKESKEIADKAATQSPPDPAGAGEAGSQDDAKKKRKILQHDDDDDETVAQRLEEAL